MQESLRSQVIRTDQFSLDGIRYVCGVDNTYRKPSGKSRAYAAVVVLSFPGLAPVERRFASLPVSFPYIPGLLSFRESPAMLAACQQLSIHPDVYLIDSHGIAHPRRVGAASHLGLLLNAATIGVAKSRLIGQYEEPGHEFGDSSPLIDKDEVIGMVVRTRPNHSPLFVSIGHKISLETAVQVVLACCQGHFLPEPTRLAHKLVNEFAKEEVKGK